ncbi:MAG TPA: VCBS repeat-containing protein [Symbiobacteriaceae bacterium]|nr:VCBS repeat-containing protein [Symbiobacteriaceae bacterium]
MRKVRYLIFLMAVFAILYALAIAVAYRWPPVLVHSVTQVPDASRTVLAAHLVVQAPVSVRLTGLAVDRGDEPQVTGTPLAGRRLVADAHERRVLELVWPQGAELPSQVVLAYRYLGWTFRTTIPITLAAKQPQGAEVVPPAPAETALGRLCQNGADAAPEAALAEVKAAVAASGTDMAALKERLIKLTADWAEPMALRADADNDGSLDTLVSFLGCETPVLVFRAAAPAEPVLLPVGTRFFGRAHGGSRIDQVADVNGDGLPEVVMEHRAAGGSADNAFMYIYQWKGGTFTALFADHLSNWRGPNQWTVATGTVSIQCRPIGPFEHKHSPNRQQTEKFRWNPATAQYELTERTREPVEVQEQQASDAEELFQSGSYDDALLAYGQVGKFRATSFAPEMDWPSLAAYRIGQVHALADDREAALAALNSAATGRYPIGDLAVAFRDAYSQGSAADGFSAAWTYIQKNWGGADWPALLDKPTLGARRAMLAAYQAADRQPPADLPEPIEYKPPLCLSIEH